MDIVLGLLSPAIALGALLSLIYAGLFHLWRGKNWRDLGIYVLSAMVGFALGQLAGYLMGLNLLVVGQVYMLEGTFGAWVTMLAVAWLRG